MKAKKEFHKKIDNQSSGFDFFVISGVKHLVVGQTRTNSSAGRALPL